MRDQFVFCGPAGNLARALDEAEAAMDGPFFISDTGDNPTAGGSGDVATTLSVLLRDRRVIEGPGVTIWTALVDASGVQAAQRVGAGGAFDEADGVPHRC